MGLMDHLQPILSRQQVVQRPKKKHRVETRFSNCLQMTRVAVQDSCQTRSGFCHVFFGQIQIPLREIEQRNMIVLLSQCDSVATRPAAAVKDACRRGEAGIRPVLVM